MSYSRWGSRGSGRWYTFWRAPMNREIEDYNTAVFEVCTLCTFTAKELREGIDKCLAIVSNLDEQASEEQLEELCIYMNEFLKDVDNGYLKGD